MIKAAEPMSWILPATHMSRMILGALYILSHLLLRYTAPISSHGAVYYEQAANPLLPLLPNLMNDMTFYVMFHSEELETPDYIGPFYKLEDAEDYASHQNQGLANNGIPGWRASYAVC